MKIETNIMHVLEAVEADGNKLMLVGQLDRKTYTEANKVLKASGGKWSRKDKAHVLPEPVADVLDPILLTGDIAGPSRTSGSSTRPRRWLPRC